MSPDDFAEKAGEITDAIIHFLNENDVDMVQANYILDVIKTTIQKVHFGEIEPDDLH